MGAAKRMGQRMNEVYLSRTVAHQQLGAWLALFFGIEPGTMGFHDSEDEVIDSGGAYAVNAEAQHVNQKSVDLGETACHRTQMMQR